MSIFLGLIPYAHIVCHMAISYHIYYSETLNWKLNHKNLKLIPAMQTNLILRSYSVELSFVSNYC
jgi:hypothetical protein